MRIGVPRVNRRRGGERWGSAGGLRQVLRPVEAHRHSVLPRRMRGGYSSGVVFTPTLSSGSAPGRPWTRS